jgi:acetate---CoA ligase (ADP-forming)
MRGRPAADVKSIIACLHALSDFATVHADDLAEIDLNPIKALPEGHGCRVVDALIVTRKR